MYNEYDDDEDNRQTEPLERHELTYRERGGGAGKREIRLSITTSEIANLLGIRPDTLRHRIAYHNLFRSTTWNNFWQLVTILEEAGKRP